jgi:hypothetical protein
VVAATLGQFSLVLLIVVGLCTGAVLACAVVGVTGFLLVHVVLRRSMGRPPAIAGMIGAASGVAGGFVGVVGLGIASTMWSSDVSAMVPVALVSALVAGSVAGMATIRSTQASQPES